MRTFEVTADMRSLLLAKVTAFVQLAASAPGRSVLLQQVSEASTRIHLNTRVAIIWARHRKHLIASRPLSSRPSRPFPWMTIRERNLFALRLANRRTPLRFLRSLRLQGRRLPNRPRSLKSRPEPE